MRTLLGAVSWGSILATSLCGETLWQIGDFNESSGDLSHWRDSKTGKRRLDYSDPSQDPVYVVGRSQPDRDWYAFQPGTVNGLAGYREHPFTIQFQLSQRPAGQYLLRAALLCYSPRLPRLQMTINGQAGWFYSRPKLAYSAGDAGVFFLPHYSTSAITALLPLGALQEGTNTLILTAVDESAERDDTQPAGFPWIGSSGIVYDAIALDHEPVGPPAGLPPSIEIEPTIFYRTTEGQLRERIDVFLRGPNVRGAGRVNLVIGKVSQELALDLNRTFGEARVSFETPAFAANTPASVSWQGPIGTEHLAISLSPARRWQLLVVPNAHLDVGYTDYDFKVAEVQSRSVDRAMELCDREPDFRFTLDGFWIVEEFFKGRSAAERERFIKLVKKGRLAVPAVYGSTFTGFASLENLIRELYPSKAFARQHDVPFDHALITDVPSYSWSFASVLAAAGVHKLVAASDAYRAPFLLYNRFHQRSPQWWEGPDGSRVLTWYSRHYHQIGSLFGLPPQLSAGAESLPRFLQAYDRSDYRSDSVIIYGTQAENTDLLPRQATLAREWNERYTFPKMRFTGFAEALEEIQKQQGQDIPVERGDGGPYWEDGLGANARITALARENMHRILSAETFATLSGRVSHRVQPDRTALGEAWRHLLLIDEHTWHADCSVRDPESQQSLRQGEAKDAHALDAQKQLNHVLGRSLSAIADQIGGGSSTLVLFNSLSWVRNGFVELDVNKGIEIVDRADGSVLPMETLHIGNAFKHVRFWAPEVPGVGYKCFTLRPSPRDASPSESPSGTQLETPYYQLELDPDSGSVRRLFDKELRRELINTNGPYRLNQFLYVTGADLLPNRLVQYSTYSPVPDLTIHPARAGRIRSIQRLPFGTVVRMESSTLNAPRIQSEIVVHHNIKRIDIANRVTKTQVYTKEAAYFAFPWALPQPRFRYATQNGIVDPYQDLLPGACREWFCTQSWLSADQDGTSIALVPIDAPLVTLGDIARGTWPKEFGTRPGNVFSYVMNNYTPEGYAAGQGGEFTFRYVITSASHLDAVALHRLGREALSPLEVNEVTRNDKAEPTRGVLDSAGQSFVQISAPNLSLVNWKDAEDGRGTILRLLETAGVVAETEIRFPLWEVATARRNNAVEDDQEAVSSGGTSIRLTVKPFEIVTLRVVFKTPPQLTSPSPR